jgi:hypothetical protein
MSSGEDESQGLSTGVKITIVGLVLQLVSLCVFFFLFMSVVIPNRDQVCRNGRAAVNANQLRGSSETSAKKEVIRPRLSSRSFTIVILLATCLIVIRSAYRVAELSSGLSGSLITNQWAFMIMDGLLILVATGILTWGHPNLLLRESRK